MDTTIHIFAAEEGDEGNVGLALVNAELTEFGSQLVPVVLMDPASARKIAKQLLETAEEVEEAS